MSDLRVWLPPDEWTDLDMKEWVRDAGGKEIVLRGDWFPVTGENATQYAYVLVEEACAHDWVDATNEIIRSGKWCRKCNAVEEA